MPTKPNSELLTDKWARRILVGAGAAAALVLPADAIFDFIPESMALPPPAEVAIGTGLLGVVLLGNYALKIDVSEE